MTNIIEVLKQPRIVILDTISGLSIEQLNKIPEGFNNNIAWNLGHMTATQQTLCYLRADVPFTVDTDFVNAYKSGSKPEKFIDADEFARIKNYLFEALEHLEKDLKTDTFKNFNAMTTRYGVVLNNIEDALAFLPFHEGLHIGYIMSLRKLV